MNIFILSYKPDFKAHMIEQAASHCDRHVIKMITESVQMLSTALASQVFRETHNIKQPPATAISYEKHPCTQWAKASIHNFTYLANLALTLCKEKRHRWPLNPEHMYELWLVQLMSELPSFDVVPSDFPVAIPDSDSATKVTGVYVNLDTAASLYQRYYVSHKSDFATWKNRPVPVWYLIEQEIFNQRKGK